MPADRRRLAILIVAMNYGPEVSGTAPYTERLARHLARDYDVQVLAGVPHFPGWRVYDGYSAWRSHSLEHCVRVLRLRHLVPARPTPAMRLLHELSFAARILLQRLTPPDVVLAVSPPLFGASAAASLARRYGVPFGLI